MQKFGRELEFISWIKRDGTGTVMCGAKRGESVKHPKLDDMSYLDNDTFKLTFMSITEKTYIASGFNTFVVRLKQEKINGDK